MLESNYTQSYETSSSCILISPQSSQKFYRRQLHIWGWEYAAFDSRISHYYTECQIWASYCSPSEYFLSPISNDLANSTPTSFHIQHNNRQVRRGTSQSDYRKKNYVNQYFSSRVFKGNLSQSISITLRDYEKCAWQFLLSPKYKVDYFH